jgi:ribosome biogenesis protein SLX9
MLLKEITFELSPYSKSHTRRLRAKAREQIGGGLSDIQAAITELAAEAEDSLTAPDATSSTAAKIKTNPNAGKIGRGKGLPFTASRRKRALYAWVSPVLIL